MIIKPFAFVLMPFSSDFDDIYKLGIQAAAEEEGIVAQRVDEQIFADTTIFERICRQIEAADFIIADMTGRNENVFYEVGYAHAKEKLCTLITQHADDIPFDLKQHRHLVYEGSISKLRGQLRADFNWIKNELAHRSTTPFEISITTHTAQLTSTEWSRDGSFELTIDANNRTGKRSPELDAIYIYTSDGWKFFQDGKECGSSIVEGGKMFRKHILAANFSRLSAGGWGQIRAEGKRNFWLKWNGAEPQDSYRSKGHIGVEVATADGVFRSSHPVDIEFDELPF